MTHVIEADSPASVASLKLTNVSSKRKTVDVIATVLVSLSMAAAFIPLVWVLMTVLVKGFSSVTQLSWWVNSEYFTGGQPKGVAHAIVGTLEQVAVCGVVSVPIGVMVGIYLVEYGYGSRLAKITTFMVDILSGVPSIVAALFVYAVWISILGFGRSGFAVSLALMLLMVPIVVRNTEEMLRVVPQDLREASYALGVPKWRTIVSIVLPTALSGIVTGIMLSVARVIGESAPVILLASTFGAIKFDIFNGPQNSLPFYMYTLWKGDMDDVLDNAPLWGAALTLVLIIAIINVLARLVSKVFSPKSF